MTALRIQSADQIGTYRPGSPEWQAARAGRISGSRVAACLGLSPFDSLFSLYHRLAGNAPEADLSEDTSVEWGTRLEDAVLAKWRDEHPEYRMHTAGTWQSHARPWQVANPDGLLTKPFGRIVRAIVEAKTARYADGWGPSGSDEIPIYYRCQVLWYLDCLGLSTAHICVLIAGSDYREYVIRRDAAARTDIEALREGGADMMRRLAEGDDPDIDEHGQTYQVIRDMHPEIDGSTVEVPAHLVADAHAVKAIKKQAEDVDRLTRSQLADLMGNAKYATYKDERVADRRARGDGTPYVQFARNLPELTDIDRSSAA